MEHVFKGSFITLPEYSDAVPVDVFHRQLEKKEIKSVVPPDLHILYRARFNAAAGKRTLIYITADDYYKLYINGRYAGQGPAPAFHFRYYYNVIDISGLVHDGENVIAVHTLYQGMINRVWVSGDDRLGLIYDIVCGDETMAKSDESVLCRLHGGFEPISTVGYSTQFMERYDSSSPETGFEAPEFDDSSWQHAAVCRHDDRTLMEQPSKPLCLEQIRPAAESVSGNRITFDFGSNYVGYLSVRAKGKKGDRIILRFGQELDDDGRTRFVLRSNCRYEEEWLLSGGDDILDEFDYKSFRYAELELPEGAVISDVKLISRHYPFGLRRVCENTDPDIVRIWRLCVKSLEYGVQEVIQDCMDREKGQYLGDGSFTSCALAVITGDLSIMEKLIDNAFDTAFINRGLMTCSPCSMMQEIAEYVLMLPHLLHAHIILSGKTDFVSRYFDRMTDVLDYYREKYEREDGLLHDLDKWCVVDWPSEARDGYAFDLTEGRVAVGTHSVINAYWYGAVKAANRLASLLGRKEYRDDSYLRDAYLKAFYDKDRHVFCDLPAGGENDAARHSALPSNAFALCFGLCPDKETEDEIVSRIISAPAGRMAFFGTFAALCGLKRTGRDDLALKLIKDDGRWLRMMREGAEVTFEAWGKDLKWNTSLFHLCYTYPVLFLCDWGMEKLFV